jgi:hypothetical protein
MSTSFDPLGAVVLTLVFLAVLYGPAVIARLLGYHIDDDGELRRRR